MFDFAENAINMTPIEILNYYRNLYYAEPQVTEKGIVANAINELLSNNKGCEFCTISDYDIDGSATYGREEDNYILYAGYSKQYDVDKFDEFETEEIKFCPMCGRKLKAKKALEERSKNEDRRQGALHTIR